MTALLTALLILTSSAGAFAQTPAAPGPETLGEVRVHGNHTTPDADVLGIAALTVGQPVTHDTVRQVEERLRASRRFTSVDVRKRFRSISDPSDVLIVIVVNEELGITPDDLTPGPLRKIRGAGMWLPVLDNADGYGFTYGARVSFVNAFGPRSRVSVPLTWGGDRRAAVEVERYFDGGPLSRVKGTLSLNRRENPFYEIGDTRREATLRAERNITTWLRAGAGAGITGVDFGDADERHTSAGVDLLVDTRRDPAFPRNAVHVTAGWERLAFRQHGDVNRRIFDARGYVGLFGSTVLALRASTSQVSAPLPAYEQALLGHATGLRGYRFGYRAGDNAATLSAELRVPLTSPLHMGRFGVKAFVDGGTVYPYGAKLKDQTFDQGVGGGVFFHVTVIRLGLDVAWPRNGPDRKPRWHVGAGVSF